MQCQEEVRPDEDFMPTNIKNLAYNLRSLRGGIVLKSSPESSTHHNQVQLLQLAAAQLALSVRETERPFNDLTKMFLQIVDRHRQMENLLMSDAPLDRNRLRQLHREAEDKVKASIVDFQFYDRMTQRINHIMTNIQQAIDILSSDEKPDDEKWQEIFEHIKDSYTMREERELFEAIRSGQGYELAISHLLERTREVSPDETEIELF